MGIEQLMALLTSGGALDMTAFRWAGKGNCDTSLGSLRCWEFTEPQLSKNNKFSFKI